MGKTPRKISTDAEAIEAFDAFCSAVESELEAMDAAFTFAEGDEEGEVVARPPLEGGECVITLDGYEGVTASWMVQGGEEAALAASLEEPARLAEWLVRQVEGGVEE